MRCHPLDPSSSSDYTDSIRGVDISTKTIFDCTVPFELKEHFHQAPFWSLTRRSGSMGKRLIVGMRGERWLPIAGIHNRVRFANLSIVRFDEKLRPFL